MKIEVLDNTVKYVGNSLDIVAALMERLKQEPDNENAQLMSVYCEKIKKEGRVPDAWSSNFAVAEGFDKKLSEAGIAHCRVDSAGDKKTAICITKTEDREKVQEIRDALLKEEQFVSRVSLVDFKRQNVDSNIHTINGFSETRAKVFQEEAKANGFVIAMSDNKDGTFNIHYSTRDEDKAKTAIMKTIESTRGVTGKLTEQRFNNDDKLLYDSIIDPQKEFYVMSIDHPNEYFHFTPDGYRHFINNELERNGDCLRSDTKFQENAHKAITDSLRKPVVLTKEEYENVKDLSREEYVKTIKKKKNHTQLSSLEKHQLELERYAHELAEYKMLYVDNNYINAQDVFDPTVSFHAFVANEFTTDLQIDAEREMAVSNPKSLPPDIEATIEKCDQLPIEDKEYIMDEIRKYFVEVREIEVTIETEEITLEDLANEDIEVMIAGHKEDITSREDTTIEEREI